MMRAALVLAALCVATPVLAQTPSRANAPAQLRLVILDETGAGIPSARITVSAPPAAPVTATADERGIATIPALPIGDVQLRVDAQGFTPYAAPLTLRRGANNQTVTLKIEGFQEQVVVDDGGCGAGDAEARKRQMCSTRLSSTSCPTIPTSSRQCSNRWRVASARSSASTASPADACRVARTSARFGFARTRSRPTTTTPAACRSRSSPGRTC